jgi:hypothetical protein
MSKYIIKRYVRCARTGCRMYYTEVVDGPKLLAQHITLETWAEGPELEVIDNYEVKNLPQNFNWRGYE